jgi:hypothetical protein
VHHDIHSGMTIGGLAFEGRMGHFQVCLFVVIFPVSLPISSMGKP